jgi:ubiquinone/menaquinone biosynthesis C-methylase UbiE
MGIRTFGIDLSFVAAKLAHIAAPGSRFVLGNAEELPFPDKHFDYIVNLGSLEHYLRPEVALAEMSRVCKDDGRLCIMVPNSRYLFGLIRSRKERFHYDGTGQIYEKMATFTEWRAMLKSSGLTVLRVYRDKEPLDTTWKNVFRTPNPRHILNKIVEKFLQAYMPLGLGYQFVFICQKESVRT